MIFKPKIIIEDNPVSLSFRAADIFVQTAIDSVEKRTSFSVAISGGSTPRAMHRMLGEEPYRSNIPWDKTCLFWVDERCVPEYDHTSNYGTAKSDFLDKVPIPKKHLHPMPAERFPEDGAAAYQKVLKAFFRIDKTSFPVFDLIFLGIGTDGHIASLFPEHRSLAEKERLVVAVKGGNPNLTRLTLTYPVLNRARKIVFLVSGNGKSEIVKRMLSGGQAGFPAQKINPVKGELLWLVDRDAASLLSKAVLVNKIK